MPQLGLRLKIESAGSEHIFEYSGHALTGG